jgi:hypothetical protein
MGHRLGFVSVSLALVLALASCAGGPPPVPLTLAVTSHTTGATVIGNREIEVSGTVTGTSAVSVSSGGDTVAALVSGGAFTANVTLGDNQNDLVVTASRGDESVTVALELHYPFLSLPPFPVADVVIGGERTAIDNSVSQTSVGGPFSPAALDGGRLYLGDFNGRRVLVFDGVPQSDGAAATRVLGQADFTSGTGGLGPSSFGRVAGVAAADGRLFVADRLNNRVLVWSSPPTTNGAPANFALGQADLGSGDSGCARDRMASPNDVVVAGGRLLVADQANRRVLVWNTLPASSAALPDLVLGQPDFVTCDAVGPSAFSINLAVWADADRVLVGDQSKNRVLLWSSFPDTSNVPPDVVLGQPDLETVSANTTAAGLSGPLGVTSNGNQIFVADAFNNRVMVWDAFPTSSGVPADRVVGQSSFTLGVANDTNQDGSFNSGVSAATFYLPFFASIVDGALIVADYSNGRYLVFR